MSLNKKVIPVVIHWDMCIFNYQYLSDRMYLIKKYDVIIFDTMLLSS